MSRRRHDWGTSTEPRDLVCSQKGRTCSNCDKPIDVGARYLHIDWQVGVSHVECGPPHPPKPPVREPCACGLVDCWECAWRGAIEETI